MPKEYARCTLYEMAEGLGDMFADPEGYYPPEKEPTFAEHRMRSGHTVRVRLVGSHPLYVRHPILPYNPSHPGH